MSEVLIETYKGVEVIFSTKSERFSFSFDAGSFYEKQSYAACKKNIDDYFKENTSFTPFKIRDKHSGKIAEVIGVRKDGRLVISRGGGIKEQLADYHEDSYILYDEKDDIIYDNIKTLESRGRIIEGLISDERKKITTQTVKEYRKGLTK